MPEPAPEPAAAAEPPPPPAAEDPAAKPLDVHAWGRIGTKLQSFKDPKKMDKLSSDGTFELHTSGAITDKVSITANFVASYGPTPTGGDIAGTAGILDLIGQFAVADEFNIWAGRMLVPVDRANFSGTWFASPWYYPGFFGSAAAAPAEGPYGRNDGLTAWGQFAGGLFKYYVGAYDLHDSKSAPLFSGRLNLSLINPEPGYYHSSTYLGDKDILAIGAGAQMKKDGSVGATGSDDYAEVNFDVLFEKNLSGGVFDAEAALYKYMGDFRPYDLSYYATVSYILPGELKLQPLFRFQGAKPQSGSSDTSIEVQLGYFLAGYSRLYLGFQHTKTGGVDGNNIFLGTQLLK